jgi:hypothetical protein
MSALYCIARALALSGRVHGFLERRFGLSRNALPFGLSVSIVRDEDLESAEANTKKQKIPRSGDAAP